LLRPSGQGCAIAIGRALRWAEFNMSPSTDALRPCILWPKHGSHPICLLSRRVVPVGVPDVIWGRHMNRPKRPYVLPRFGFMVGCYVLSLSSALARGTSACVTCAEETRRSANKLQSQNGIGPNTHFQERPLSKSKIRASSESHAQAPFLLICSQFTISVGVNRAVFGRPGHLRFNIVSGMRPGKCIGQIVLAKYCFALVPRSADPACARPVFPAEGIGGLLSVR
jgi:hypothetical protein